MTQQEQAFFALLTQEQSCAQELLQTLKTENETLRHLDSDSIIDASRKKTKDIKALEDASQQCMDWLRKNAHGIISLKIRDHIQSLFPENQHLLNLLDEIKKVALECQRLNDINGGIIALSQQYTQRALSILHGDTPGDHLYGKEGKSEQTYSPKTLGKV